jgi:hypothetical protein
MVRKSSTHKSIKKVLPQSFLAYNVLLTLSLEVLTRIGLNMFFFITFQAGGHSGIPPIQVTAKVLFGSVAAISALNAERKKKA